MKKIYTKTGDSGETGLLNGKRVAKYDLRIELNGNLDELVSHIGVAKSIVKDNEIKEELTVIQQNISTLMSQIAFGNHGKWHISSNDVLLLEKLIDKYQDQYPPFTKFIMPGDSHISSELDVCRTVARRAERYLYSIERFYPLDDNARQYINRLSDLLYTLARYMDFRKLLVKEVSKALQNGDKLKENKELKLCEVKILLEKIEQKAREMELPVVIAVANNYGNIIAVHFMDDALPASYDIAVNKAYTSAALRISTKELNKLAKEDGELYGINNTNEGKIVTFSGGYPLMNGNKVIGGLGVSGGTAEQDEEIAAFGSEIFKEGI